MSQTDIDEAAYALHQAGLNRDPAALQVAALEYAQALGWKPPVTCDRLAWVRVAGGEGGAFDYIANVAGLQYAVQRFGCGWRVSVVRSAAGGWSVGWQDVGVYPRLAMAKLAAFEDAVTRAVAR